MFNSSRKDEMFYGAFREQSRHVCEAAVACRAMFDDLSSSDRVGKVISEHRRSAGAILKQTVRLLHSIWITPLDRHQIHSLVSSLDGVVSLIDAATSRVVLFGIRDARGESLDLAGQVNESCQRVAEAIELLPKLSKDRAQKMLSLAGEIHEIEGRADETHRRALAALFDGSCEPLTVMKWQSIFDNLEQATDLCRDVSQLFEAIVLENA